MGLCFSPAGGDAGGKATQINLNSTNYGEHKEKKMKKLYLILVFCLAFSACSDAKPKVTFDLNGRWSGLTGDEKSVYKSVYMVIEDNGFRIIDIVFVLPNCPFAEYFVYYKEPQDVIQGNSFSLKTQYLSINGVFDAENSVSGDLEITQEFCDGNINTTWVAEKGGPSSIPPSGQPIPETIKMPDSKISSQLFQPNAGSNGFGDAIDPFSHGDWDLARFSLNYAHIPIPRGWTVLATQNQMVILANEKGIYVELGLISSESDNNPIEEAIAEAESRSKSNISLRKVIDSQKGYIFGSGQLSTGEQVNDLIVVSKDPSGKFNYFRIIVTKEKWKQYYPIMQDMVEYWILNDGTQMGISLPDSLADQ